MKNTIFLSAALVAFPFAMPAFANNNAEGVASYEIQAQTESMDKQMDKMAPAAGDEMVKDHRATSSYNEG